MKLCHINHSGPVFFETQCILLIAAVCQWRESSQTTDQQWQSPAPPCTGPCCLLTALFWCQWWDVWVTGWHFCRRCCPADAGAGVILTVPQHFAVLAFSPVSSHRWTLAASQESPWGRRQSRPSNVVEDSSPTGRVHMLWRLDQCLMVNFQCHLADVF